MKKIALVLIFIFSSNSYPLDNRGFEVWKNSYAKRASKRGIPYSFIVKQLKNVKFNGEIFKKEKKQITSNKSIDYNTWIKKWLRKDSERITTARKMLSKHRKLLNRVEQKYQVDKKVIIALWGVETFFGKIVGDHDLVSVLATLSSQGRRKKFFEIQLNAALRLMYRGHVTRDNLKGSWAGATGQLQFMPSNFNGFAQDFDGDKRKDIWTSKGDIFASIAYYLKKRGWKKGKKIGTFIDSTKVNENKKKYGVIPFQNSPLILKGPNYKVILGWNNSSLFAALNMILIDGLSEK